MRMQAVVWPAAGGPPVKLKAFDELVVESTAGPMAERVVRVAVEHGKRVAFVNPDNALVFVVEPAADQTDEEEAPG